MPHEFDKWIEALLKTKYDEGYKKGYANGFYAGWVILGLGYIGYKSYKWVKTPIIEED